MHVQSASPNAVPVSIGLSPPSNPRPGDLWWDASGGQLYVWYNDGNTAQWVASSSGGAGAIGVTSFNARTGAVTLTQADVMGTGLGSAALANTGASGHTLPYLDGANIWTAANQISSTGPGVLLTLSSTDGGAAAGPILDLVRYGGSPAANDTLGQIRFLGMNSALGGLVYNSITSYLVDPTAGNETVLIIFQGYSAGVNANRLLIGGGVYTQGGMSTGGDKGLGTANFGTYYEAGVALTAKYGQLAVANNWTAAQTINVGAVLTAALTLISTDDTSVAAFPLELYKNSATPAVNDFLAEIGWYGNNASLAKTEIAGIRVRLNDPTATLEDGQLLFRTVVDGNLSVRLNLAQGLWTQNALGQDKGVDTINAVSLYESGIAISQRYAGGYHNVARRNGGFEIWQRGAGGSASFAIAASTTTYTADGWYLSVGVSQAATVTQSAGLTDQSQWSAKVQRNAGQTGTTFMSFGFPLDTDEIYPLLGQFVRLSAVIKAGANFSGAAGTFRFRFRVGTGPPTKYSGGAGYVAESTAILQDLTITTTAVRYQFTTLAIVPVNTRQAEVQFSYAPVGTAGADDSFTVDDVQLEVVQDVNQVSSPFERLTFEESLVLCQRHYQKTFNYPIAPAQNAGGTTGEIGNGCFVTAASAKAIAIQYTFPVPMRVAPAITTLNHANTNAQVRNLTVGDCSATAPSSITTNGVFITATGHASGNPGDPCKVHLTADAGI